MDGKNGYAIAYRKYSKLYLNDENWAKKKNWECGKAILIHQKNGEKLN